MTAIRRVRAVVVTFNNAAIIEACLAALEATSWPGALDIVVVDNASVDGTADFVAARFPHVRLIRSETNLGFGGGCNLGMGDLAGVDAVALVNSDAVVSSDWLAPLAATLDADPGLGAACPKILFAPRFVEVSLAAPLHPAGGGDPRRLGVSVIGADPQALYPTGFSIPEPGWRWTNEVEACLWLPVDAAHEVTLAAAQPGVTHLQGRPVDVGPTPTRHPFVAGEPFDVINNVGNELTPDGYGRDRGFLEPDRGQYDQPAEVWGWCGAAVLLRARYLEEVGRFDERLFLYYEDIELAWRGRKAGWRYRYVPTSIVRHAHAASSGGEASAFFDHLNQRNRLVVLARHASRSVTGRAWARYARDVGSGAWGEIASPLLHRRRPFPNMTRRRLRAAAAAARLSRRPPTPG